MSELFWPPTLIPSRTDITVIDSVGRFSSPLNGITQTVGRPGSRLRMSLSLNTLNERKRLMLQSLIAASRGGTKPIRVPDHSYTRAGSFSGAELVTNPTFASGTTGYTVSSVWTMAVNDRVLRLTRVSNTGAAVGGIRVTDAITVTPYQPYVGRALVMPGRGPSTGLRFNYGSSAFASDYLAATGYTAGLIQSVFVPYASTVHYSIGQGITTSQAGDTLEVSYLSLAPCALIDNAPNVIPYSVDLSNAAWNQGARMSVAATAVTLPDGSSGTTNTLHEDATASNTHFLGDNITVSSLAGDWCMAGAFKAANRTWVQIRLQDVDGAATATANLNLSTGTIGTVTDDGTVWDDARAYVVSIGNGWYYLALIARNKTSNTNIGARIFIGEGDADVTFSGADQDSIYAWRPTLAQSSVPIRLSATTGTAYEDGNLQNLGGGLYTKGWPVSTSGLLLPGDQVEIGGQLQIVTGPVNSDAAGRAFLPIPSLRRAPVDNEPVIIVNPMGRFIPEEPENGWTNVPGIFSDSELVLVESG